MLGCLFVFNNRTNAQTRQLISAEHVYTVDGEVYSPGQVLVVDGKIAFVGAEIETSQPTEELKVHSLMPGIVNVADDVGLSGGDAEVSREITPDFDTASAIDWESREFAQRVDQGVTTAQILPGTDSVFCGFAATVKTAPVPDRMLTSDGTLVMAICSDPTSRNRSRSRPDSIYVRQPTNRMGVVWIVRSTLHRLQQGQPLTAIDPATESILKRCLDGGLSVASVSRTDFDIRSALELGEQFGFEPTIYGGDEVYRMVDEFKASKATLVYTALTVDASSFGLRGNEGTELRWNIPGQLHSAGIPFCLGGRDLLNQARFAVRFGLPRDVALKSITLAPSKILGMQDQVGSISVGKDADLVAFNGDPLQPTSGVAWTMVSGQLFGNDNE